MHALLQITGILSKGNALLNEFHCLSGREGCLLLPASILFTLSNDFQPVPPQLGSRSECCACFYGDLSRSSTDRGQMNLVVLPVAIALKQARIQPSKEYQMLSAVCFSKSYLGIDGIQRIVDQRDSESEPTLG